MNTYTDKVYSLEELKSIIVPIIKDYGATAAYLFGSYARGEATSASDIDIRITRGDKIRDLFQMGGMYAELEDALQKPLDIVTTEAIEHSRNPMRTAIFAENISRDEEVLYE